MADAVLLCQRRRYHNISIVYDVSIAALGFHSLKSCYSPMFSGNYIKGAESALRLEQRRSETYKGTASEIEKLGLRGNKVCNVHARYLTLRLKNFS